MNCEFKRCEIDGQNQKCCCTICDNVLYASDPARCHAECRGRKAGGPCRYLGDAIAGSFILITCETCQGNVRMKHPVHECAIRGRCAPTAADPDGKLMHCSNCPDAWPLDHTSEKDAGDDSAAEPHQQTILDADPERVERVE